MTSGRANADRGKANFTKVMALCSGVMQAFVHCRTDDGNGTKKPTGFLNGTPVSTGDADSPARAFGTLQYYPTGNASGFQNDRLACGQSR